MYRALLRHLLKILSQERHYSVKIGGLGWHSHVMKLVNGTSFDSTGSIGVLCVVIDRPVPAARVSEKKSKIKSSPQHS